MKNQRSNQSKKKVIMNSHRWSYHLLTKSSSKKLIWYLKEIMILQNTASMTQKMETKKS